MNDFEPIAGMAWNEPGKKGDDNNAWKQKTNTPDLEALIKKLQNKWLGSGEGSGNGLNTKPAVPIILVVGLIILFYIISGVFVVQPAEKAVILQFGKYHETVGSGPHWIPRIIDSATKVNVQMIQTYAYDSDMLTKDENIVNVAVAVQYRISNPENYLFNAVSPIMSLQQATASALRQVIGNTNLDEVLTSGRDAVSANVTRQLEAILNKYQIGLKITQVALQPAKAPDAIKDAFDDAIKAQEDELRYKNQAEAYRMQIIPNANGAKQRILADSQAYKQQVVLNAQGETARYLGLLPSYQQSPQVTRERLYLGAMQNVLSQTTKIFVDQPQGSNTIMYLPLDQILNKQKSGQVMAATVPYNTDQSPSTEENEVPLINSQEKAITGFSYGTTSNNPYGFATKGGQ